MGTSSLHVRVRDRCATELPKLGMSMLLIVPRELTTEHVRMYWERFAPRYDRSIRFWERVLKISEGRRWVASQAIGDVLEPLTLHFQGDNLTREPLDHIKSENLQIEEMHRWAWGIMERVS